ncbi:MAG: GlsB/YeaQ/YmgE family stress response membrane protein [Pseudomonadota bacterium]
MGIIWTVIIGFVAGIIAKWLVPGDREPSGFILTALLGVFGAFVATWIGQSMNWYGSNQGAGLIGAVVGSVIVLVVWGALTRRR